MNLQNNTSMNEITKYPLFGKSKLKVDEIFGGLCYQGDGYTISPAFRGGPVSIQATIDSITPVRTFSSGSEFMDWTCRNCDNCGRYKNEISEPTDLREGGCALELRLALAYMGDGKIPFKVAKRIGYTELHVCERGVFVRLSKCKEFISK